MSWSDTCRGCGNHRADCECVHDIPVHPKTGMELISEEHSKQLGKWGTDHDSTHKFGEMASVAAALCISSLDIIMLDPSDFIHNGNDSWGLVEKHKNDRVKQLQIAGALIASEINRISSDK